jgi:hypothetical protein
VMFRFQTAMAGFHWALLESYHKPVISRLGNLVETGFARICSFQVY